MVHSSLLTMLTIFCVSLTETGGLPPAPEFDSTGVQTHYLWIRTYKTFDAVKTLPATYTSVILLLRNTMYLINYHLQYVLLV